MKRIFIKVQGIVQGVGFRPYVYNLAINLKLNGWVNNNSEGVYIDIEGNEDDIKKFIYILKSTPPPLSRIENIKLIEKDLVNYTSFTIKESEEKNDQLTLISPDVSICKKCIEDIYNKKNRRYKYAFTNCTNCGPRFTIIDSLPYDRNKTTMKNFKMCGSCYKEYTNPIDRRFHAQPNSCWDCGPHLWVSNNKGEKLNISEDILIEWIQFKLKEGKIFAIKGIGGFHLACDAHNTSSIELLRHRKCRPHKAFAMMMKDINTLKKHCEVNSLEQQILTGIRKPILILNKKTKSNLPKNIAPNQKTLGVMLPYTPLHILLFYGDLLDALIMTSGNVTGLPIEYKNDSAIYNLKNVADYFIMHNRDILVPIDDSIVNVINNEARIIRRGRGYVPEPLKFPSDNKILACGSNMKNSFCISKNNFLFLSQYNGDLKNLETFKHFKRNINHFKNIFSFEPDYITYDMHPNYISSEYALNSNLPKIPVQHHHAHIASCMVENNIYEDVIGVAFDGTGFGADRKIWGGEFLICNYSRFKRISHLDYVPMPGGEKAIKEPFRMAISYLYKTLKLYTSKDSSIYSYIDCGVINKKNICHFISEHILNCEEKDCLSLINLIESNVSCPQTSSMGRLFDAVSSILNIRDFISYEGQASIELEAIINESNNDFYPFEITLKNQCKENENRLYTISPYLIIYNLLLDKLRDIPRGRIALKFHNTIVELTLKMCKLIRNDTFLNKVALSGGVFQNSYLLEKLIFKLEKEKFIVYTHKVIPPNDEGVSLGQIAIANEILNSYKSNEF